MRAEVKISLPQGAGKRKREKAGSAGDTVREFREALRQLEEALKRMKVLADQLEAVVTRETRGAAGNVQAKKKVWIGHEEVECYELLTEDGARYSAEDFVKATEFSGAVIMERKQGWEVWFCRGGKIERIQEGVRKEDVEGLVRIAKENGMRVWCGGWWYAVESERIAELGAI